MTDASFLDAALPVISALIAFGGAIAVSSLIGLNKGAKVNRSWAFIAAGLILMAFDQGCRFALVLGSPGLGDWTKLGTPFGLAAILIGVVDWRWRISSLRK